MSEILELLDYRRRVAEIYRKVRANDSPQDAWEEWRQDRDSLFVSHPQSPVEDRSEFDGLPYFGYDPAWRMTGVFESDSADSDPVPMSGGGTNRFHTVGTVTFDFEGVEHSLRVLWLDAYGGGLFIPFKDHTNVDATYGGGRYLLDTVKGADLGHTGDEMILDFNFAYHPSCVHSPRWSCPLAPPANNLGLSVRAGERLSEGRETL